MARNWGSAENCDGDPSLGANQDNPSNHNAVHASIHSTMNSYDPNEEEGVEVSPTEVVEDMTRREGDVEKGLESCDDAHKCDSESTERTSSCVEVTEDGEIEPVKVEEMVRREKEMQKEERRSDPRVAILSLVLVLGLALYFYLETGGRALI